MRDWRIIRSRFFWCCGHACGWRRPARGVLESFALPTQRRIGLGGPWDDAARVTRCGGACQAGEPRALAAARRRPASPQISAAGQADAIPTLIRRTLNCTKAPIWFVSLRSGDRFGAPTVLGSFPVLLVKTVAMASGTSRPREEPASLIAPASPATPRLSSRHIA